MSNGPEWMAELIGQEQLNLQQCESTSLHIGFDICFWFKLTTVGFVPLNACVLFISCILYSKLFHL